MQYAHAHIDTASVVRGKAQADYQSQYELRPEWLQPDSDLYDYYLPVLNITFRPG